MALSYYRDIPRLDFAAAYLAGVAVRTGPPRIASFDRRLRRIPGITVLSEPSIRTRQGCDGATQPPPRSERTRGTTDDEEAQDGPAD